MLRAYRNFEQRAGNVRNGRGAKSQQMRENMLGWPRTFSILEIEGAYPGASSDTGRPVHRQMKSEGVISPMAKGQSAKWRMGIADGMTHRPVSNDQ